MDNSNLVERDTVDDSDTEEVPLTAAEVIKLMQEAWLNEKFAPEILPNKAELVNCLLAQIKYMEENLKNLENTDFRKSIHQLEVDRIRFVISSYLRIRLKKIETYVFTVLKQEEQRLERNEELYLTNNELAFARNYKESVEQLFEDALSFWPGLPFDDWKDESIVPNYNSFVFFKSKNEVEGVVIDEGNEEGDVVDFKAGSQLIMSYNSVDQETLLKLIPAANYLDIKSLMEATRKTVANMIKCKTPEELRKTFSIKHEGTCF